MRTILRLSSHIEATRYPGRFSKSGIGEQELPTHSSPCLDLTDAPRVTNKLLATTVRDSAQENGGRSAATGRADARVEEDLHRLPDSRTSDEEGRGPKGSRKPGIVIIHSRTVFRDCLAQCLELAYDDHDISSFSNIAEWLATSEQREIDAAVVIVVVESVESSIADLEMLESNEVTAPVVIVSDTGDLNHIIRILKSGVRGYIPTSLSLNVAVEALRLVKAGGTFIPASSIVPDGDELPPTRNSAALTTRQMEIVEEIRHGKANKQIAYDLKMSEHTVKVHLRHIMRKLKARNRTEVAVMSGNLLPGAKDI